MAEASGLKVADLLPGRFALAETMRGEVGSEPDRGGERFHWGFIGEQAEAVLRGALDCDLVELLAEAWAKARVMQDYADPAKHPPGETAIVHLGEHKFVREIHPALEVTLGAYGPFRLRFTISLAAHVRSIALSVRGGHIVAGSPGDAWVSAQLKYGGVKLTSEKESSKVPLPGRFAFKDPGIRIPPRAASAESAPA